MDIDNLQSIHAPATSPVKDLLPLSPINGIAAERDSRKGRADTRTVARQSAMLVWEGEME